MLRFVEHCGNWEAWPTLKLLLKRFTPGGFKSILRNFLHSVLPPPWKWTAEAFFFHHHSRSLHHYQKSTFGERLISFSRLLRCKTLLVKSNLNTLMVKHWQSQKYQHTRHFRYLFANNHFIKEKSVLESSQRDQRFLEQLILVLVTTN